MARTKIFPVDLDSPRQILVLDNIVPTCTSNILVSIHSCCSRDDILKISGYFMKKVPPGEFCTLLLHMQKLSDYKMPQKGSQNDGLALHLKTVCHTSNNKIVLPQRNPTCAENTKFCTILNQCNPFLVHFRRRWTKFTGF